VFRPRYLDCSSDRVRIAGRGKLNHLKPASVELCRNLVFGEKMNEVRKEIVADFGPRLASNRA
jgi:hypothetical protein